MINAHVCPAARRSTLAMLLVFSAPLAIGDDRIPSHRLAEMLIDRGLATVENGSGDTQAAVAPPSATAQKQSPDSLSQHLRKQLAAAGWSATRNDNGDLVFLPPQPMTGGPPQRAPAPAPAPAPAMDHNSWSQQLRETLQNRGWSAVPDGRGGMFYYPPHALQPDANSQESPDNKSPGIGASIASDRPQTFDNSITAPKDTNLQETVDDLQPQQKPGHNTTQGKEAVGRIDPTPPAHRARRAMPYPGAGWRHPRYWPGYRHAAPWGYPVGPRWHRPYPPRPYWQRPHRCH